MIANQSSDTCKIKPFYRDIPSKIETEDRRSLKWYSSYSKGWNFRGVSILRTFLMHQIYALCSAHTAIDILNLIDVSSLEYGCV